MASQITENIVKSLKARVQTSEILTQSSPGYDDAIKRWSDAAVKRAGMILLATNAEDISEAVRFVQEHKIDLAIRGGGHSCAGTSSSNGGLVIDLSLMRNVTVDAMNKTITAQGGSLWIDVDEAAGKHGLATVGGTVNHTGIGGLTLGGGYGWLSPKYGLVIDNLISATMVLADGRIVTTSATEEPDLFWAIRGAGHNFGVAVDFTYRAHDQPNEVFAGAVVFTPDKLEGVVDALNYTLDQPDINTGAMCIITMPPGSPVPMVIAIIFYNGPEEQGRKRFEKLFALEPVMNDAKMIPYTSVNAMTNANSTHGGRRNFKGVFYNPPLRSAIARKAMDVFTEKSQSDPEVAGSAFVFEFWDSRKMCETPLSATAFPNRGMSQNGVLSMRWTNPADDVANRQWARDVQMMFKREMDETVEAKGKATNEVPQYLNYAEPGDVVVSSIYGTNTERLQKLKAKYDPTTVFGKISPITPVP